MKRGIFTAILGTLVSFISLVSSYTYSYYPGGAFPGMNSHTLTLAASFVIIFSIIFFALKKFMKDRTISAVISLASSLLSVHYLNKYFEIERIFSGVGISGDTLFILGPILILTILIWISYPYNENKKKRIFKPARFFFLLGGIFTLASITEVVEKELTSSLIGIFLIIIGMIISLNKKSKNKQNVNQGAGI